MDLEDAVKTDDENDSSEARSPSQSETANRRDWIDSPKSREVADTDAGRPAKPDDNAPTPQDSKPGNRSSFAAVKDHPFATALIVVLLCAAIAGGVWWWLATRDFESTDDAFIDGRPISISALVAGEVVEVPVTDNQLVSPGTVLARIDDRDYVASQALAKAQLEQAQASVKNAEAQFDAQQSRIDQTARQITEAQASLSFSKDENVRYQDLAQRGAGTVQRAQQAASDLQSRQAAMDAAEAAHAEAQKQLAVLQAQRATAEAQVRQAEAQRQQAAANLSRVVLTAPVEGRVTRLTGAAGAYAAPGQSLMILVPTALWVTANFKETQLAEMRPGQHVNVEIDAYGRSFAGRIDSLQAGSGTAFSLLPAENATGNYVKVVQRVPVKIVFDQPPDVPIGPGMSVVPSVKVRER